jgi:hypothetical protein
MKNKNGAIVVGVVSLLFVGTAIYFVIKGLKSKGTLQGGNNVGGGDTQNAGTTTTTTTTNTPSTTTTTTQPELSEQTPTQHNHCTPSTQRQHL